MWKKTTHLVCSFLIVMVLAGCVDEAEDLPPAAPVESDGVPRTLAELTCEFVHNDNETEIPCENQFTELGNISAQRPDTSTMLIEDQSLWVCVEQSIQMGWQYSIHWDPDTDRFGIYYSFDEVNGPFNAVFYTRGQSMGTVLYDAAPSGFVVLPDVGQSPPPEMVSGMTFIFYTHDYITDTPELEGGSIQALWSWYKGTPYPLHVIETGNQSYYFDNVTERSHGADNFTYHLNPFTLERDDFNVTVQAQEVQRLQISWNPHPQFCAI